MSEKAWAQLVSTTDAISDPVIISKDRYVLGRNADADLCFDGNKLVSGKHCFIERTQDGKTWLQDTSTNGCLLNLTIKVKKTRVPLHHGDEIHLVYRKADLDANVAFLFQDLAELAREETDTTLEYSSEPDHISDTQPAEEEAPEGSKRPADDEVDSEAPSSKRARRDGSPEATAVKPSESDLHSVPSAPTEKTATGGDDVPKPAEDPDVGEVPATDQKAAGGGDGTSSEIEKSKAAACDAPDPYEETLICIICQEILHNCVSLQPCMHSFCAGCYSEWMDRSTECPSCRGEVKTVSKNHLVNNFVEVYLTQHPEKRRPEEELKELDARSKITQEQMKPKEPTKDVEDDSDDDEEENDSDDERFSSSGSEPPDTPTPATGLNYRPPDPYAAFAGFMPVKLPKTVCRQCPEYVQPPGLMQQAVDAFGTAIAKVMNKFTGGGTATGGAIPTAGPATAAEPVPGGSGTANPAATTGDGDTGEASRPDEKIMPTPPDYECTPGQNHALCQCCFEAMPDRRHEHILRPQEVPPMQCRFCYRNYCHAYWGCRKAACMGCIGHFRDMNFGKKSLDGIVLDNQYESEVLVRYLGERGITVKDLLASCCERLDNGGFTCTDQGRGAFTSDTVVCYQCGLRNFKDLVFQYRRQIPDADLPAGVTNRTKCHWGKNCRTQRHKLEHAVRYNHICDQTMTTPF